MKPAAAFLVLFCALLLGRPAASLALSAQQDGTTQLAKAPDTKAGSLFHTSFTESKNHNPGFDLVADIDDEDDLARKLLPLVKCLAAFSLAFSFFLLCKRHNTPLPFPAHLSLSGADRLLRLSIFRI